jgi:hypothetical protein
LASFWTGWNSLEAAKLVVAVATPVVVLLLGLYVRRAGRRIEDAQWSNRKLIERRLELYDKMAPLLNDLFCFFTMVGDFRSVTPPIAIDRKRELDKVFHINRHLFDPEFARSYDEFMKTCFITYEDVGSIARLRARPGAQRAERGEENWESEWEAMLLRGGEVAPSEPELKASYERLMNVFAREVGVGAGAGPADEG